MMIRDDAQAILGSFSADPMGFYQRAIRAGKSLSAQLQDEYAGGTSRQGDLDVFDQLMAAAGIRTWSDPAAGVWASTYGDLVEGPARGLLPEWQARVFRRASSRSAQQSGTILPTDFVTGGWARPYADSQEASWDVTPAPAVPLASVVSLTTGIDGDSYRSFYLTDDTAGQRQVRVSAGGEIPVVKLTTGERAVNLYKYGRAIEVTYEALRRARLDYVARLVQRVALQAEIDMVVAAIATIINGDGNSGTAATEYDLTTLDAAATAGTPTLAGWLAAKLKLTGIYRPVMALAPTQAAIKIMLLSAGSSNLPAAAYLAQSGLAGVIASPAVLRDTTTLGVMDEMDAGKVLIFDPSWALIHLVEIGATLAETERYIKRQVQLVALTQVAGFAVSDPAASVVLDIDN